MTLEADDVEPAQPIEETLKYKGKLRRTTIARSSYAECLDEDCPKAWTGPGAIGGSSNHSIGSGHQVVQHYQAAYVMTPTGSSTSDIPLPVEEPPATIAKRLRLQVNRSKVTTTNAKNVGDSL